jgi:pyrimidine-nucleoside phosphorylase
MGQTSEIAPADRKMYALRDATATVESIPLIASSIMSKKLAEDLTGLVLDIKRGSGAFLTELNQIMSLSREMISISIGERHGCPVVALFTAMDRPLGRACGNALEVEEAIAALKGEGPDDLVTVTLALSAEMLVLAGVELDREAATAKLRGALRSGDAAEQFRRIIERQGGDASVLDDPALLPQAAECELCTAPRAGIVQRVEPRAVGRGVVALGGGRSTMADAIDPAVGFVITAKPGDWVEAGEPLASIYARDRTGIERGRAALRGAITIGDEAEPPLPLISHRLTTAGVEELA